MPQENNSLAQITDKLTQVQDANSDVAREQVVDREQVIAALKEHFSKISEVYTTSASEIGKGVQMGISKINLVELDGSDVQSNNQSGSNQTVNQTSNNQTVNQTSNQKPLGDTSKLNPLNNILALKFFKIKKNILKAVDSETQGGKLKGLEIDKKISLSDILGEAPEVNMIHAFRWMRIKKNILKKAEKATKSAEVEIDDTISLSDLLGSTPEQDILTKGRFFMIRQGLLSKISKTAKDFDPQQSVNEITGGLGGGGTTNTNTSSSLVSSGDTNTSSSLVSSGDTNTTTSSIDSGTSVEILKGISNSIIELWSDISDPIIGTFNAVTSMESNSQGDALQNREDRKEDIRLQLRHIKALEDLKDGVNSSGVGGGKRFGGGGGDDGDGISLPELLLAQNSGRIFKTIMALGPTVTALGLVAKRLIPFAAAASIGAALIANDQEETVGSAATTIARKTPQSVAKTANSAKSSVAALRAGVTESVSRISNVVKDNSDTLSDLSTNSEVAETASNGVGLETKPKAKPSLFSRLKGGAKSLGSKAAASISSSFTATKAAIGTGLSAASNTISSTAGAVKTMAGNGLSAVRGAAITGATWLGNKALQPLADGTADAIRKGSSRLFSAGAPMLKKVPIIGTVVESIFANNDIKGILEDPTKSKGEKNEAVGTRFLEAIGGPTGAAISVGLLTALTGGLGLPAAFIAAVGGDLAGRFAAGIFAKVLPTDMIGSGITNAFYGDVSDEEVGATSPLVTTPTPIESPIKSLNSNTLTGGASVEVGTAAPISSIKPDPTMSQRFEGFDATGASTTALATVAFQRTPSLKSMDSAETRLIKSQEAVSSGKLSRESFVESINDGLSYRGIEARVSETDLVKVNLLEPSDSIKLRPRTPVMTGDPYSITTIPDISVGATSSLSSKLIDKSEESAYDSQVSVIQSLNKIEEDNKIQLVDILTGSQLDSEQRRMNQMKEFEVLQASVGTSSGITSIVNRGGDNNNVTNTSIGLDQHIDRTMELVPTF